MLVVYKQLNVVNIVTVAMYMWICWLRLIGLVQRSFAIWRRLLHLSDKPGDFVQCFCQVDCTVNIGVDIMIII